MATHHGPSQKAPKVAGPRRGEIYLVNFDPTIGAEIRKTRPALVIQNDIGNQHGPIIIVAAISSKFTTPPYPTEVLMYPKDSGLPITSVVVLNQIRSVDRQRLIQRVGKANTEVMTRVNHALEISLGLIEL